MASYQVFIETEVHRNRKQLPGNIRQRIARTIDDLAANPRPTNSQVLDINELNIPPNIELRRVRIDRWRIVYAISDQEQWVWVLGVHRRPPYDYEDIDEIAFKLR